MLRRGFILIRRCALYRYRLCPVHQRNIRVACRDGRGCREAGTYGTLRFNTSDGIIIIDAIFDYSVEDEIVKRIAEAGLGSKENLNTSS